MITEREVQEAIAECLSQKNPNANTCIKLAAFYTILQHMGKPEHIAFTGDSEFAKAVKDLPVERVYNILDETMQALETVCPRLYEGTMKKLRQE